MSLLTITIARIRRDGRLWRGQVHGAIAAGAETSLWPAAAFERGKRLACRITRRGRCSLWVLHQVHPEYATVGGCVSATGTCSVGLPAGPDAPYDPIRNSRQASQMNVQPVPGPFRTGVHERGLRPYEANSLQVKYRTQYHRRSSCRKDQHAVFSISILKRSFE